MRKGEGILTKFVGDVLSKKTLCDMIKEGKKTMADGISAGLPDDKGVIMVVREAYKLIINKTYGVMGQSGGPVFALPLAIAVTDMGRKIFNKTAQIV